MSKMLRLVSAAGLAVGLSTPALAQTVNYSGLTSAVDFGDVAVAMVAVAGTIIFILVARKGIRFILGMLR